MDNNELSTETIKLIRKSIRERLSGHVSDYKIRKVIKAHIENPCAWSAGRDDESRDDQVQLYYRNISHTWATNIFLDFRDTMQRQFGILV